MSLAYPSRAAHGMAFGFASLALLLGLAAPVEAQTVNYVEGVWATAGGTNPAYVATGSDTNIGILLTPKGTGGVGISTTSPQSLLHVYNGEVQVGSSGASCAAGNNGAIRFSGSTLYYCTGTTWTAAGGSTTLNGITAATANQAGIANGAYTIQWNWGTLTTGNALTLASTSMTTGSLLNLSNTNGAASAGTVLSVTNAETATVAAAIYGHASGATGATFGIYGLTDSVTDYTRGVYGFANGASGVTFGVVGETVSTTDGAAGVWGHASGATNAVYGVFGEAASASGFGVYGTNSASGGIGIYGRADTGAAVAILGESSSDTDYAIGVEGAADSTTAQAYGVFGETFSTNGGAAGVYGSSNAVTGGAAGVWGKSYSTSGYGVYGRVTTATGTNYGVYGQSDSSAGYGAYFTNTNGGYALATGAGKVGIGTTSPNTNLDLYTGFMEWGGQSRVSSTFSKTSSAALAAITGLSATLTAAKTYYFDILLYTTSGNSGGIKVDLNGGGATATSIIGDAFSFDAAALKTQTRVAALNTALCAVTAVTAANCHITGTITVNAGGTFIPRFAQNASNGTASTVAIGSIMIVQQIN